MAELKTDDVDNLMTRWGVAPGMIPATAPLPPAGRPDAIPADTRAAEDVMLRRGEEIGAREVAAIDAGARERNRFMMQPIRAPRQPNLMPIPPAPKEETSNVFDVFKNPAIVLATLGSIFTRTPLMAAMKAATGAMEGYRAGERERVELERAKWKDDMDRALRNNQLELEKYNAAFRATELSVQERSARLQAIAAGTQDEVMKAAVASGNLNRVWEVIKGREAAQLKLLEIKSQEDRRVEALPPSTKIFNSYITKYRAEHDGQDPPPEEQQKFAQNMKLSNNVALQKFLEENPEATATEIQNFLQQSRPPRSASAMAVQKFLQENPDATAEQLVQFNAHLGTVAKAERDFGTGPQSKLVNSLNVGISHAEMLRSLAAALQGGDIPRFRAVAQQWAKETGNAAPTNFETAIRFVGPEIVKALVQGGGGQAERQDMESAFARVSSPDQINGAIDTAERLLSGQFVGLKRQYETSTGLTDFDQHMTPEAWKIFQGFQGVGDKGAGTAAAPTVIRYDASGNRVQ